jgi:hypothetical protein
LSFMALVRRISFLATKPIPARPSELHAPSSPISHISTFANGATRGGRHGPALHRFHDSPSYPSLRPTQRDRVPVARSSPALSVA